MNPRLLGFLLVLCATMIEAFGQILLKKSALHESDSTKKNFYFAFGVLCLAVEAIVWSNVLRLLDVSVAYPMGSLSFVAVTIFSWLLLKEKIVRERWLGVSLILCGTALLGIG